MFRISALLMATLLLFNAMPVSLAQQNPVAAQAEADANSDMSDMAKAMWFTLGGLGSTAGCLLGCVGGCALGTRVDGGSDVLFSPSEVGCAVGCAILFGALAVPIGVHMYPHNVTPPPERLLGKSPEYVEAYTQIYTSKTTSLRKRLVIAGSIAGNVGMVLATLLAYASID